MLNKYSLALACALTALPQMALAEDDAAAGRCVDASVPRHVVEARKGKGPSDHAPIVVDLS